MSISEGDIGLGNMGITKTSWFTALHDRHQTWLHESLSYTLKENEEDRHRILDYWAIPVHWQIKLFQQDFWNDVRRVGSRATEMGPLTYGSRRSIDSVAEAASFSPLTNPGLRDKVYFEAPVITDEMTEAEKRYWEFEYIRRQHAHEIFVARNKDLLSWICRYRLTLISKIRNLIRLTKPWKNEIVHLVLGGEK